MLGNTMDKKYRFSGKLNKGRTTIVSVSTCKDRRRILILPLFDQRFKDLDTTRTYVLELTFSGGFPQYMEFGKRQYIDNVSSIKILKE